MVGLESRSPEFFSLSSVEKEFMRQFDICHVCRLCFNLCPFFPALFDLIDREDGDVQRISYREMDGIVDLCYQCKLCYVKCPYKPPHEFEVDIPRLLLRGKAARVRKHGLSLQDLALGSVDLTGALGSLTAPIANVANKNFVNRAIMQRIIGVHKDRILPAYHRETFSRWFKRHEKERGPGDERENGSAALFYTCFVNYNNPEVGKAAVAVLERNGIHVVCPEQRCCGMPYLDGGDMDSALYNARFNLKSLKEAIEKDCDIVVLGPTCGYVIKKEYPQLLGDEDSRLVSSKVYDVSEYLMKLHKEGVLDTSFKKSGGKIAYHFPCHMKAQGVGYKSVDLMRLVPDTTVEVIERGCSGMDGTWGLKAQYYDMSLKAGRGLVDGAKKALPARLVTDCPLAGLQIEQGTGIRPFHPMEILKDAYAL